MAKTTFTNNVTLTDADWFNDADALIYDLCGDGTNEPTTKAQVRQNLGIDNLTEDTAPVASADYIETYDTSATTSKKVLLGRAGSPTLGTAVASTSGTSIDFTGIPAWAKKITILFVGLSTNGTSNPLIQIGDSGGIETSGYLGSGSAVQNSAATVVTNFTTGFGIQSGAAGNILHGKMELTLENTASFTWCSSHSLGWSSGTIASFGGGSKSLSATLDRIRITTVSGADTFDAGEINIQYE